MRPLFAYLDAAVVPDRRVRGRGGLGLRTRRRRRALVERIERAARDLSAWMVARAPARRRATRMPTRLPFTTLLQQVAPETDPA